MVKKFNFGEEFEKMRKIGFRETVMYNDMVKMKAQISKLEREVASVMKRFSDARLEMEKFKSLPALSE